MSRRNAVEMSDERYVQEHFDNMLSCPQCYSERWLAGMSGSDPAKFIGPAVAFYATCSEMVKEPHRCGKRA